MLHSNESPPDVPRFPAPWSLRGHAWMVALRLPAGDPARTAFVPADLRATVKSAFSVLMCVVYDEAPCGPYRELLFIPGTMDFGDARHPSISRILVSTWESVVNGRSNWGIPKDRADFDWTRSDTGDHWRVTSDGRELCSLDFTEPTGVRLPLSISPGCRADWVPSRSGRTAGPIITGPKPRAACDCAACAGGASTRNCSRTCRVQPCSRRRASKTSGWSFR